MEDPIKNSRNFDRHDVGKQKRSPREEELARKAKDETITEDEKVF